MTRAGLPSPLVWETTGVTPKACAARQEETITAPKSFMVFGCCFVPRLLKCGRLWRKKMQLSACCGVVYDVA